MVEKKGEGGGVEWWRGKRRVEGLSGGEGRGGWTGRVFEREGEGVSVFCSDVYRGDGQIPRLCEFAMWHFL